MHPIILHADYLLDPQKMDFNKPVEIHVTRFNTPGFEYPLYRYQNNDLIKIHFKDHNSYKVLLLSNEPVCSPNKETVQDVISRSKDYNLILCTDTEIIDKCDNAVFFPYGTTWLNKDKTKHPDALGEYFNGLEENFNKKEFGVSFMTTANRGTRGYEMRHQIWNNRNKINIPNKFYSSSRNRTDSNGYSDTYTDALHDGIIPNDDKSIIFKSQFSIIVENCVQGGYFSEKIVDCLLTKTIPIYFGCPNIDLFFNSDGILKFNNMDELINIINSLSEDTYNRLGAKIGENLNKAKYYASCFSKRVECIIKSKI